MYRIECNNDFNFELYREDKLISVATWISDHLQSIADKHHIDISHCESESHQLAVIQDNISVKVQPF